MKNTVRVILTGLTTFAVAFSSLSLTALATKNQNTSDMTELIISSQEAYAGDIVTVSVDIKNNPGITAFGAVLSFDEDLEFVGYEKKNLMTMINVQTLNERIAVVGAAPSEVTKDASFVGLTFKIPESATRGSKYNIAWVDINQLSAGDKELINIQIDGCITIIENEEESQVIGNINFDDKVDASDATLVLRYYATTILNLGSGFSEESIKAADVNGDGVVNAADATLILKFYGSSLLNPNTTWDDILNS